LKREIGGTRQLAPYGGRRPAEERVAGFVRRGGGQGGGRRVEPQGGEGAGRKKGSLDRFFHLSVALVGNYAPTPRAGSYWTVLEQQKRYSKTPPPIALQLHGVVNSTEFWS
jgi:hypothetical protein